MKIERFEELDCWRSARELVKLIYKLTQNESLCRDFSLRDQIQRAALSTMANIVEGFANRSDKEFIRFLGYSTRSAFEVQSHLYAALDLNYIDQKTFSIAYESAQNCANLCRGFIRYLKK